MKTENKLDLKLRTKKFALRIIRLYTSLPKKSETQVIGKQILSVGANYREAFRARSNAEFKAKMGVVIQELDETLYWLELLVEGKFVKKNLLSGLMKEADELISIFIAAVKTLGKKAKNVKK